METRMGTVEPGVLNLLINPRKNITFNFSHPETLIWKD
jgi:ribosomal-protein-alanine N-acetyltransferase